MTTRQTNQQQLSLEEVDLLVRKCNHLHDEKIVEVTIKFFRKIGNLFGHHHADGLHHPAH